jgi:HEPN domain-containing protein
MAELPFLDAARDWRAKADGDLRSARTLLSLDPPETDAVAFHCQQAAEKYLKALLVAVGVEPPRTHDLGVLRELASDRYPELKDLQEACEYLTPFAVQTRYPLFEPPITAEDASQAMSRSEQICELIRELIFTGGEALGGSPGESDA